MRRGDHVLPRLHHEADIEIGPKPDVEGRIVFTPDDRLNMAMDDVVFLDRGTSHGLDVGSPLEVYRPIGTGVDKVRDEQVALPDDVVAKLLVVRAGDADGGGPRDPHDRGAGPRRSLQGLGVTGQELPSVASSARPRVFPSGIRPDPAARLPHDSRGAIPSVVPGPGEPLAWQISPPSWIRRIPALGFVARCTPGSRCRLRSHSGPRRHAEPWRRARTPRLCCAPARRRGSRRASSRRGARKLARIRARLLPFSSDAYPERLRRLVDAPPLLVVRGDPSVLRAPAVAIVGARAATHYGRTVARDLAATLARAGLVVVSGLAVGVDAAAHEGALEAGGLTVAFQACGPDRVYPAVHRRLADRIARAGAVVSELPPGTPPRSPHFPLRNRLISASSLAVVVVEARRRSGSLITARHAADQGVDVFAVPGPITAPTSQGPNRLIQDGAIPLLTPTDILEPLSRTLSLPLTELRPGGSEAAASDPSVEERGRAVRSARAEGFDDHPVDSRGPPGHPHDPGPARAEAGPFPLRSGSGSDPARARRTCCRGAGWSAPRHRAPRGLSAMIKGSRLLDFAGSRLSARCSAARQVTPAAYSGSVVMRDPQETQPHFSPGSW